MIRFGLSTLALGLVFFASPANAINRVYLKSTGSGTTCSLVAPCASLLSALSAAGPNGLITCIDSLAANEDALITISNPVTIACGDGMLQLPTAAIFIVTPANSRVIIEGVVVHDAQSGGNSIQFSGQGTLELIRVRSTGSLNGNGGLQIVPNGPASVLITDSVFSEHTGAGILIKPSGSGYANVHIRNTIMHNNQHGLFVDGAGSTIGVNVNLDTVSVTGNQQNGVGAFNATAGGAPIAISMKNSQISGNLINGVGALAQSSSGPGSAVIEVNNSMITANANGLAVGSAGQIRSFGNNQVRLNSNNGAFTGSAGLQ